MEGNSSPRPTLLILAGATATGKTELGITLAESLNCHLVSADSRQVYRYMDIGTAKPDRVQQQRVKHYLIDIINPDHAYNAGLFLHDFHVIIAQCRKSGLNLPLIVGGTGLYIQALLDGLAPIPDIPAEILHHVDQEIETLGLESAYHRLMLVDPDTARKIYPQDRQRISRFISIYLYTGKTMTYWKSIQQKPEYPFDFQYVILQLERDKLYQRINIRVDQMIKNGLIDEVASILNQGYAASCRGLSTYGYREIISYLQGQISLLEAVDLIKKNTRHYAKRQMTWFNKIPSAHFISAENIQPEQIVCLLRT